VKSAVILRRTRELEKVKRAEPVEGGGEVAGGRGAGELQP